MKENVTELISIFFAYHIIQHNHYSPQAISFLDNNITFKCKCPHVTLDQPLFLTSIAHTHTHTHNM